MSSCGLDFPTVEKVPARAGNDWSMWETTEGLGTSSASNLFEALIDEGSLYFIAMLYTCSVYSQYCFLLPPPSDEGALDVVFELMTLFYQYVASAGFVKLPRS
jgi:hypothetical protein